MFLLLFEKKIALEQNQTFTQRKFNIDLTFMLLKKLTLSYVSIALKARGTC